MTDHASHCGATKCPQCSAAQDCASDSSNTCTYGSSFFLRCKMI